MYYNGTYISTGTTVGKIDIIVDTQAWTWIARVLVGHPSHYITPPHEVSIRTLYRSYKM